MLKNCSTLATCGQTPNMTRGWAAAAFSFSVREGDRCCEPGLCLFWGPGCR